TRAVAALRRRSPSAVPAVPGSVGRLAERERRRWWTSRALLIPRRAECAARPVPEHGHRALEQRMIGKAADDLGYADQYESLRDTVEIRLCSQRHERGCQHRRDGDKVMCAKEPPVDDEPRWVPGRDDP